MICIKLKSAFVSSVACQNFEESWHSSYGEKILLEFSSWVKELVSLHRAVRLPGKTARPQVEEHSANSTKAAVQGYKCVLCCGTNTETKEAK